MALIDQKAKEIFANDIFDKSILLKFREKVNLPTYVLENLIMQYGKEGFNDEEVDRIYRLLLEKVVRVKDNLKVQAKIRETGEMVIIDKVNATSVTGQNKYWASLLNLGGKKVKISNELVNTFPDLLENGLWAELTLEYRESDASAESEFEITKLVPAQRTRFSLEIFRSKAGRFERSEWLHFLLRSIGLEPGNFTLRQQLLLISRLIPYVENNYNFVELGARGTGKSYTYRQFSGEAILVSGGKTTVANLFYNMGTRQMGLVGKWDIVAFDEVAYIDFEEKTMIQILKDYMELGSFSRGKEEILAGASLVFLGNVNQSIPSLLQTSHLFEPLPELMKDMALIDRFHFYLPGWEMKKLTDQDFSPHYGLFADYLAMALSHLRELDWTGAVDDYFDFVEELDSRDKRAIKKTVSGFLKLLHPAGDYTKEDIHIYMDLASEGRKRVKEQLIRLGSFEYKGVTFEYYDRETKERFYPTLPETIDTEFKKRLADPGVVYIGQVLGGRDLGLIRLRIVAQPGTGQLVIPNDIHRRLAQDMRRTFLFVKSRKLSSEFRAQLDQYDFYVYVENLMKQIDADIGNAFFICLYSLLNNKSVTTGLLVTENTSLYRKASSDIELKALVIEDDPGHVKTLLPLDRNSVFVEVPSEVIAQVPYFIKV